MIISFYSYKGGVGRSQLCANVAAYLYYNRGQKVLIWDWDFEAPGQHFFFGKKNEDIKKKGTLEMLEDYCTVMRSGKEIGLDDLKFVSKEENIVSLVYQSEKEGAIDLLAAGTYGDDFSLRANNFNWFEFYSMLDGVTYIEHLKKHLHDLGYDAILIDSRTGISDYSGICNIQLPDVNVIVVAPTMQNFEGSKSIINKILTSEYNKINKKLYILPILSRLDYSNPDYNSWVKRFADYFSFLIEKLDEEFDTEFLQEIFSGIYFKDTFLPYTPAISAGENILFDHNKTHSPTDYSRPFINITRFLESLKTAGTISFYKRIDQDTWQEYALAAKEGNRKRKAAIAYTQIGIKQNDADKKIENYNEAIKQDSTYYLPYFYAANNYTIKDNKEKAIEYFQKAVSLKEDFIPAYYNLGLAYSNKEDNVKAIECFEKVIALDPRDAEALSGLGVVYDKMGEQDKAISYFLQSIVLQPDNPYTYNNLGIVYSNKNEHEKALEQFKKTVELDEGFVVAWYNLGVTYDKLGDYKQAISSYQKAIELRPEYAEAYNGLGVIYGENGEPDKAVEYYEKAIQLKPDYPQAVTNLGVIYLLREETEKAIELFQSAIRMKPDYADAYDALGQLYDKQSQSEQAREYYQKAIALQPKSSSALNNLGFLFLKMKDLPNAEKTLRQAIDNGAIEYGNMNIGHVYLCRNNISKALEHYNSSFHAFKKKDVFWKAMDDDFNMLKSYNIDFKMFDTVKHDIGTLRAL